MIYTYIYDIISNNKCTYIHMLWQESYYMCDVAHAWFIQVDSNKLCVVCYIVFDYFLYEDENWTDLITPTAAPSFIHSTGREAQIGSGSDRVQRDSSVLPHIWNSRIDKQLPAEVVFWDEQKSVHIYNSKTYTCGTFREIRLRSENWYKTNWYNIITKTADND